MHVRCNSGLRLGRSLAAPLLALSTILVACSDDTLKVSEVRGCYVLVGIMGVEEIRPLPVTLDDAAGISVLHAGFFLGPDRTYTAWQTFRVDRDGTVTDTTTHTSGSYRLHKDEVTLVSSEGNESTLTFDPDLRQFTGPGLPPHGPGPHMLVLRMHVFDGRMCAEAL